MTEGVVVAYNVGVMTRVWWWIAYSVGVLGCSRIATCVPVWDWHMIQSLANLGEKCIET